jgi:hypothetical protein
VAGVRPVCIQCRRVLVSGGLLVGISRSIIMTAYEVPLRRVRVPMRGWEVVTGGVFVRQGSFEREREF